MLGCSLVPRSPISPEADQILLIWVALWVVSEEYFLPISMSAENVKYVKHLLGGVREGRHADQYRNPNDKKGMKCRWPTCIGHKSNHVSNSQFDTFFMREGDLVAVVGLPPDPRGFHHGKDHHHGHQDRRPHPGHRRRRQSRSQVKIFGGRLILGDCRLPGCAMHHCSTVVFSPLCTAVHRLLSTAHCSTLDFSPLCTSAVRISPPHRSTAVWAFLHSGALVCCSIQTNKSASYKKDDQANIMTLICMYNLKNLGILS